MNTRNERKEWERGKVHGTFLVSRRSVHHDVSNNHALACYVCTYSNEASIKKANEPLSFSMSIENQTNSTNFDEDRETKKDYR